MDHNQFLNMNNTLGNYATNTFDQNQLGQQFNQQPLQQQVQPALAAAAPQQQQFLQTTGNDHITQLANQMTANNQLLGQTQVSQPSTSTTNHLQKLQQMQMMAQLQQYGGTGLTNSYYNQLSDPLAGQNTMNSFGLQSQTMAHAFSQQAHNSLSPSHSMSAFGMGAAAAAAAAHRQHHNSGGRAKPVTSQNRGGRQKIVLDKNGKKKKKKSNVKRPMTAYLYFVSKFRQKLKENGDPIPKAKEMTQECARKWRVMDDQAKESYQGLADIDRQRWIREKAAEKKPRDPNRPKRPPSAYFLFLTDFRHSYPTKNDPAKEITKKAGAKWNSLGDEEKGPYVAVAQEKRLVWEAALKEYKRGEMAKLVANKERKREEALGIHKTQEQPRVETNSIGGNNMTSMSDPASSSPSQKQGDSSHSDMEQSGQEDQEFKKFNNTLPDLGNSALLSKTTTSSQVQRPLMQQPGAVPQNSNPFGVPQQPGPPQQVLGQAPGLGQQVLGHNPLDAMLNSVHPALQQPPKPQ